MEPRNPTFSPILRTIERKKKEGGSGTRLESKLKRETFYHAYLGERRKVENLTGKNHGSSRKNSNLSGG